MTLSTAPWVTNIERAFTINTFDENGDIVNVSSAVLTIYLPGGTTVQPSVSTVTTGTYEAFYTPTVAGHYGLIWQTTGDIDDSFGPDSFDVYDPTVIPGISLADVKAHLNIQVSDHVDDGELMGFIAAATGIAEAKVGLISRRSVVEVHSGEEGPLVLNSPPVVQVSSVTESGVTLASSMYACTTSGVLDRKSGYTRMEWVEGFNNIVVTYVAGRESIPADLGHAMKELVKHLWETQRGTTRRRTADDYTPTLSYSLPRRVEEILDRYSIMGIA